MSKQLTPKMEEALELLKEGHTIFSDVTKKREQGFVSCNLTEAGSREVLGKEQALDEFPSYTISAGTIKALLERGLIERDVFTYTAEILGKTVTQSWDFFKLV